MHLFANVWKRMFAQKHMNIKFYMVIIPKTIYFLWFWFHRHILAIFMCSSLRATREDANSPMCVLYKAVYSHWYIAFVYFWGPFSASYIYNTCDKTCIQVASPHIVRPRPNLGTPYNGLFFKANFHIIDKLMIIYTIKLNNTKWISLSMCQKTIMI